MGDRLLGHFPTSTRQQTMIIESAIEFQVIQFLWGNIFSIYDLPRYLVSDNETKFSGKKLKWLYKELHIDHRFGLVHHPQTSGQATTTKNIILNILNRRINTLDKTWEDGLNNVLYVLWTTPKHTTSEININLVYWSKSIAPTEVTIASYRTKYFEQIPNEAEWRIHLDLANEKWWVS